MAVVITGASRGIGRGLFDHYRDAGTEAIGTTREDGAELPWVTLDVTDPEAQAAMARKLDSVPVDILVCNAGIFPDRDEDLATGYPPEMWARTFATNVTGVFLTVQALLTNLQLADRPRVAIMSSQLGSTTRAGGGSYIYRASKAAALNLGRNLAQDLGQIGIAVGIYHPGWVRTDMGGEGAAIEVEDSAAGLAARFDELSLETTGRFLTWDGKQMPF